MPIGLADVYDGKKVMVEALLRVIKRMHDPVGVILVCVRWYAACPPSLRRTEDKMAERGMFVDGTGVCRWANSILPILAAVFRRRKGPLGLNWRMDKAYIKVCGQWKYLYRAVERDGHMIDFLTRARRFLARTMELQDVPEKISIDTSGANTAAHGGMRGDCGSDIELRQSTYFNNIVEQDHGTIDRVARSMIGCRLFRCAQGALAGIQTMRVNRKGLVDCSKAQSVSAAPHFCSLAS